jgi:hypothetical protein
MPKSLLKARVFPCGHANSTSKNDPQQVLARTEGHCCYAWQLASEKAAQVEYGVPQLAVDWYVRGLTYPIPEQRRRSKESEATGGWPGLCCDPDTGLYIGGVGNNCRRHHKGPERCIVHCPKTKSKANKKNEE